MFLIRIILGVAAPKHHRCLFSHAELPKEIPVHRVRHSTGIDPIPALKTLSHLPVIADPSHATGRSAMVPPMALAATAAGADGLIIEVHNDPQHALCDGPQSQTPEEFAATMEMIGKVRGIVSHENGQSA